MQEDIIKSRDSTGLQEVGMLQKELTIKGMDDAGRHYKKAG